MIPYDKDEERHIIRTKEQLVALKLDEIHATKDDDRNYRVDITTYTDAYFSEKTLVLFECTKLMTEGISIGQLRLEDNCLTAEYIIQGNEFDGLITQSCLVLLEVDRVAVEPAEKITLKRQYVGKKSTKPTTTATTTPAKKIPFTVKEVLYGDDDGDGGRDYWQILRSREELLATELDKQTFQKGKEYHYQIDFSAYPDAYFTDKVLLLLVVYNEGSNRNQVDELLVNGELLIANYTEFQPPEIIFEAIPCYLLLEVDRADVERVTTLKMQETLRNVSYEEMPD